MMIDTYDFGRITINGKSFDRDLIIFSDKIKAGWWRKEGHRLQIEDLDEVLESKPEVLIVGTGYYGEMVVSAKTKKYVEAEGIEVIVQKTSEACKTFNHLTKSRKAAAALHLTC